MKRALSRAKVALYAATDGEWYVLIAACALVVVFITIMTGHITMKF